MPASPTAEAWARLAEQHRLRERLERGEVVPLSADDIRAVGREPRLMTKFDTRESRPEVLTDATILPVTNGQYVVLPGAGYADLDARGEERVFPLREALAPLRTLPWASGPTSEAQALDMALASGILGDFLGDPAARLTVRGRHRSPRFQFRFRYRDKVVPLTVEGVQIEVDSGLEGNGIHLVEAKLGTRTNFHVRQLYYPLRWWLTDVHRACDPGEDRMEAVELGDVPIGPAKLRGVMPRDVDEADDAYVGRVVRQIAELIGGYSISHVSGRFRANQIASRAEAAQMLVERRRYLIDETTAIVRFIIPCPSSRVEHGKAFDLTQEKSEVDEAIEKDLRLIRALFFSFFVETVVRPIQGEDVIWLIEQSAYGQRLYTLEKGTE